MHLRFQKWDIAVIAAILAVALAVFAAFLPQRSTPGGYAEIYQDGKLLQTVSLSEDQEFTVTGKCTSTITVRDGKIAVTASDCSGNDCVSCGWLDHPGQSIVCLPNGLEIRVLGIGGDVDFVVG